MHTDEHRQERMFQMQALITTQVLRCRPLRHSKQHAYEIGSLLDFPTCFQSKYTGTPNRTMIKPGQVYCGL